jgi:hypothetical protein
LQYVFSGSFFKRPLVVLFGISCIVIGLLYLNKPNKGISSEGKNRNSGSHPLAKIDLPPGFNKDNIEKVPFAKNQHSEAKALNSNLLSEEWEEPLFDILGNTDQDMDARNQRLMELATNRGKLQPAVQQECLSHLLYGLPDSDLVRFTSIVTAPSIPIQMRMDFLNKTFNLRPAELNEPLAKNLLSHPEGQINNLARLYLIDLENSKK